MKQKWIKIQNRDGSVRYDKSRLLYVWKVDNGYVFKDPKGQIIEPTDLELELLNESQTGGTPITNGWLTFLGIITLINFIFQLVLTV